MYSDIMTVSIGILCEKGPKYGLLLENNRWINTQLSANDSQGL